MSTLVYSVKYNMEDWNQLLVDAILPLCKSMKQKGVIKNFNFYRDWNRGEGIKLVYFGEKDEMNKLVPLAQDKFLSPFLDKNPSNDKEIKLPLGAWFLPLPNNSVVKEEFKFHENEIVKISGGKDSSKLVFDYISFTSELILDRLSHLDNYTSGKLTPIWFQAIVSFFCSLGLDIEEQAYFSSFLYEATIPKPEFVQDKFKEERKKLKRKIELLETDLEQNFAKQSAGLVGFVGKIVGAIGRGKTGMEFIDSIVDKTKLMNQELQKYSEEGTYIPHSEWVEDKECNIPIEKQRLWPVYELLIRTITNQIGLHNANEINATYMMSRTYQELLAHHATV